MQSSFSMTGRSARERIGVPDVPMDAIHRRSRALKARERARLALCATLCLAALGASAVFGAGVVGGVRMWLSGDRGAISIDSFVMMREPTVADVRAVIARATFPVVLPVGMPAGTRVTMMFYAPKDRPDFIQVRYARGTKDVASFSLVDSRDVESDQAELANGSSIGQRFDVVQWHVGAETVVWQRTLGLTPAAADHVRMSMADVTPEQSVAATARLLRRIVVEAASSGLADAVERYAPLDGRVVLLGTAHPREIAAMAEDRKPILDSRIVYLSDIPFAHGAADYARARLTWPKTVVIAPDGVRAIDAVFRSIGVRGPCACAILFDGRDAATYDVWKIPLSSPATPTGYTVDAKTLAVRPR